MPLANKIVVEGMVLETLPNGTYVIGLKNGHRLIGWWPRNKPRVQISCGDRVEVEVSFFDLSHGKIVKKAE